jgi:hypothetical protein
MTTNSGQNRRNGSDEGAGDSHRNGPAQGGDRDERTEQRKERVLHTRIPASLETEIKRLADSLRIPVSNLVRNMLQDAVAMLGDVKDNVGERVTNKVSEIVEDVSALSSQMTREVERERARLRAHWLSYQTRKRVPEAGHGSNGQAPHPGEKDALVEEAALADVLGWQPLTLNIRTGCAGCGKTLVPGTEAFLGLRDSPGSRVFVCSGCLPRRGSGEAKETIETQEVQDDEPNV